MSRRSGAPSTRARSRRTTKSEDRGVLISQDALSQLRAILDSTADGILLVDAQDRVVYCNGRFLEIWNLPEHVAGASYPDLVHAYLLPRLKAASAFLEHCSAANSDPGDSTVSVFEFLDGRAFEVRSRVQRDHETAIGRVWTFYDVTEHTQLEAALRESEQRYRHLFESNPHPMWVYDNETYRFLAVNDSALHHYGYGREEFLAMRIVDIRPPEDIPAVLASATDPSPGHRVSGKWRHRKKDGAIIEVEIQSHRLGFLGRPATLVLATDVTERKRLEEQLRQTQKMEAVGRLAGGVAHDFNNLLTAIMGYAQLMAGRLSPDDRALHDTQEILKASGRAAMLTRQLLAFSRKEVVEPRVFDLNALVGDMGKMLRRLVGEDIALLVRPDAVVAAVRADPGQVEQVILNLTVNAQDSMPGGGRLIIETQNVELGDTYVGEPFEIKPGAYVLLAVTDTGTGMDEQTKARIFEPFFTTKGPEKGTGLGLATVYGIVQQSGGSIQVYSEMGRGSTFKVYLPRVDAAVETLTMSESLDQAPRGTETILLVEDQDAVAAVVRVTLQARGYQVLEARHGGEALQIWKERGRSIALIITDVIMPVMNGPELVRRIRAVNSAVRVLFMSGYTERGFSSHDSLRPGDGFLQKPFLPAALAHKVREVLDSPEVR